MSSMNENNNGDSEPSRMPIILIASMAVLALVVGMLVWMNSSDDRDHGSNVGMMNRSSSTMMDHDTSDMGSMHHGDNNDVDTDARKINVTASSFAFSPAVIRVKVGEPVAIVLKGTDIVHDFTADGLDLHVSVDGKQTATGGFTATKAGTYSVYCSEPGHKDAGMKATIKVEEA